VDYLAVSLKPASQTATVDRAVTMELARWNCGRFGVLRQHVPVIVPIGCGERPQFSRTKPSIVSMPG